MTKHISYMTSDGILHINYDKAKKHADQRYGNHLTSLAHKLLTQEKYKDMTVFLDTRHEEFRTLLELAADRDNIVDKTDDWGE